ncbi:hypothetical protein OED52_13790 [Rhodococcus sp. Z13]|uniref:Uncharacterized protein n=1 Tax=Rhodococcus sacchari TaxID=2962047 RepID=A0ACD4DCC5_9NOCA|nr:hypothetical protein [Rhodococcus sp. Z13]UYP17744.1 hypothetical protein OED52_13790 [Rhodococcus sp. Z13]
MTATEPGVVYTTADLYNLPAGTHIRELGALGRTFTTDNTPGRLWLGNTSCKASAVELPVEILTETPEPTQAPAPRTKLDYCEQALHDTLTREQQAFEALKRVREVADYALSLDDPGDKAWGRAIHKAIGGELWP